MPPRPAARYSDPVIHPGPPVLSGTKGSPNVNIGFMAAWRGCPAAVAAALQAARKSIDVAVNAAEAATKSAAGTPGAPAALAAETAAKTAAVGLFTGITGGAGATADIHQCTSPSPPTPVVHGPGMVIDGSPSVLINHMPACRQGDTVLEALGPPNKIVKGWATVIIGD